MMFFNIVFKFLKCLNIKSNKAVAIVAFFYELKFSKRIKIIRRRFECG